MIYDITPPMTESLAVWPGDTPLSREVLSDISDGAVSTSSAMHTTAHLGAHADAPSHILPDGPPIDQRALDLYLGPCQVARVPVSPGDLVTPEIWTAPIAAERLLVVTDTYDHQGPFSQDFAALAPEFADRIHREGVRLVGVDTPSVDLFAAEDLPTHRRLMAHDMAILEGLVLRDVPDGIYELIALPLKLVGFDASPVRAILRAL